MADLIHLFFVEKRFDKQKNKLLDLECTPGSIVKTKEDKAQMTIKEVSEKTDVICALRLWNLDGKYKGSNNLNIDIFKLLEREFELEVNLEEIFKEKHSFKIRDRVFISMGEKFKWPSLKDSEFGK